MISKDIVYEMIDDRVAYLQDCTKSHKRNYDTKLAYFVRLYHRRITIIEI